MKRIDSVNARPDENGLGKAGFNDNADLPGQDATHVTPDWFNTVQEELCNLLELRGITLDPNSKRQLYDLLTTQTDLVALATEIENNFIRKSQIIDNLTTNDPAKPISAAQAKLLQDKKIDKDEAIALLGFLPYMPTPYPKAIPPDKHMAMMGQALNPEVHPILFSLYGPTLPDMRAYTVRGLDYGRGIDVGRVVLTQQEDAIVAHKHNLLTGRNDTGNSHNVGSARGHVGEGYTPSFNAGDSWISTVTQANVALETRVKNIAYLYIVREG